MITKSSEHCYTFNTCMILISPIYVLVVHLLNARPNKLFALADLQVTVNDHILQLGNYRVPVEPSSTFLLPEICEKIKENQRQQKVEKMFQRGLLSVGEFEKMKADT